MCARQGKPAAEFSKSLTEKAEGLLTTATPEVQQLACELLAASRSASAADDRHSLANHSENSGGASPLPLRPPSHQGRLDAGTATYLLPLTRRGQRLRRAQYVPKVIDFIKQDALTALPEAERVTWEPLIARKAFEPVAIENRTFVRHWEMDDLEGSLGEIGEKRDLARGKAMFDAALCSRCHKIASQATSQAADPAQRPAPISPPSPPASAVATCWRRLSPPPK